MFLKKKIILKNKEIIFSDTSSLQRQKKISANKKTIIDNKKKGKR